MEEGTEMSLQEETVGGYETLPEGEVEAPETETEMTLQEGTVGGYEILLEGEAEAPETETETGLQYTVIYDTGSADTLAAISGRLEHIDRACTAVMCAVVLMFLFVTVIRR